MNFPADSDAGARAFIERIDALSTHHDPVHEGVRVRWRRFGNTETDITYPPLVLLHGGHGSWMHWIRNVEALSARHTLWLPDMPGFLDSDKPLPMADGQAPIDPLLKALGGTLDMLIGADTPVDLGGFSFGGLVASTFATRRPVRRLALVGSGGHASLRRLTLDMINWRRSVDRQAERAALKHNLDALMLHDKASDPLAFEIHDVSCHGTRFRSKDVSMAGGLQAAIDTLTCPLLLMWGEYDVTADPRPLVARLTAGHPNRGGAVVDGAGHWTQYERADEVNRQLLRFFD